MCPPRNALEAQNWDYENDRPLYRGINANNNQLIQRGMSYNPFQQGTVVQQPQWLSNFQQWMNQFGGNR